MRIPVWSSNKGVQVMARVAIQAAGAEAAQVRDLAELKALCDAARPHAVVVDASDLAGATIDATAIQRMAPGARVVVVGLPRNRADALPPGAVTVPLPFTVKELSAAIGTARPATLPSSPLPVHAPAAPPVAAVTEGIVAEAARAEVERVVAESVRAEVERLVAESVRAEVERLVAEDARRIVAEVAQRVVPELAEAMIRAEIDRLVREAGDAALRDPEPGHEAEP